MSKKATFNSASTVLQDLTCIDVDVLCYNFNYIRIFIPQIALALGVLTSSWGVRVRRFCGFVAGGGGLSHRVSWRCRLACVGVRVRRSKTGLSHGVSLEV